MSIENVVTVSTVVWPGLTPRLLRDGGVEDYAEYATAGGYRDLDDVDALLAAVESSGLLGRGGAAFPLAVKLRTVRDNGRSGAAPVVVANGEEGEPASVKDKWLMRNRPHLVLDGLRLAARAVGATRGYVYVSDPHSAHAIDTALGDAPLGDLTVSVVTVDGGYVAGEETAAVRAVNGGPAKPTDKPPRPFEEGVGGAPTLVSNVETLAHVPFIHQQGSESFRAHGTSASPGTFLATVTGAGLPPVLYELPHGTPVGELLERHGVPSDTVKGVLMGGYFAGLLNREVIDATLDHEAMRRLGSGLGCGAVAIITDHCPVAVAASVLSYFDRENAGQCGSCFNGTAAMAAVTCALVAGSATSEDLVRLERWSVVLRGRGACATLDAATNVAASLIRAFPNVVERHVAGSCETCSSGTYSALRPYEVEAS